MNVDLNNENNFIDNGHSQIETKVELNENNSKQNLNIAERLKVIKAIPDKDRRESMVTKLIGEMLWDLYRFIDLFKQKLVDECVEVLQQEIEHFNEIINSMKMDSNINDADTNDDGMGTSGPVMS